MWLGGSYNVTVVVGCCIHKPKAGRGLGAENPKPNVTARFLKSWELVGFKTGNPQVGISHTVPVAGTGSNRPAN
jgi:hypothetical protein